MDVDWDQVQSHFVTLTYHDDGDLRDSERWHQDLATFWKRIQRDGCTGLIWKLEMKPRLSGPAQGVWRPHWHTIALTTTAWPDAPNTFPAAWAGVLSQDAIVDVQQYHEEKGRRAALCYLAKYLTKVTQDKQHPHTGRIWGYRGHIPMICPEVVQVPDSNWETLIGRIRLYSAGSYRMATLSQYQSAWTALGCPTSLLDGLVDKEKES